MNPTKSPIYTRTFPLDGGRASITFNIVKASDDDYELADELDEIDASLRSRDESVPAVRLEVVPANRVPATPIATESSAITTPTDYPAWLAAICCAPCVLLIAKLISEII